MLRLVCLGRASFRVANERDHAERELRAQFRLTPTSVRVRATGRKPATTDGNGVGWGQVSLASTVPLFAAIARMRGFQFAVAVTSQFVAVAALVRAQV